MGSIRDIICVDIRVLWSLDLLCSKVVDCSSIISPRRKIITLYFIRNGTGTSKRINTTSSVGEPDHNGVVLEIKLRVKPRHEISNNVVSWFFVSFDSWRPINNLSVIKGRFLLGWTSTKLGLMFLFKDTTQWRRWGSNPQPLGLE